MYPLQPTSNTAIDAERAPVSSGGEVTGGVMNFPFWHMLRQFGGRSIHVRLSVGAWVVIAVSTAWQEMAFTDADPVAGGTR